MSHVDIFRSLADPTRLAVFECVVAQEMTVTELTQRFEVSQPAVSQHLTTLRTCGLVSRRREGKHIFYCADPRGMRPMIDWLNHYQAFWKMRLPRLQSLLEEMEDE